MWCLFSGKADPGFLWTDVALCLTVRAGSTYTAALSRWPRMEATLAQKDDDLAIVGHGSPLSISLQPRTTPTPTPKHSHLSLLWNQSQKVS